jgi:hypothetical protein
VVPIDPVAPELVYIIQIERLSLPLSILCPKVSRRLIRHRITFGVGELPVPRALRFQLDLEPHQIAKMLIYDYEVVFYIFVYTFIP